jgi:hypothetical protein
MPQFQGTTKEFHRYIGPRIRNFVQSITKGYRKDLGKCEEEGCEATEKLEAAHIHGRERPTLIMKALEGFILEDNIDVDLKTFEIRFKELHYPLNETIKILCERCHRKYDSKNASYVRPELKIEKTEPEKVESKTLPIELDPCDKEVFREAILRTKKAKIIVRYDDGEPKEIDWNAANLNNQSNIFGNLRSRPEFRQGNWQENGIVSVLVKVVE